MIFIEDEKLLEEINIVRSEILKIEDLSEKLSLLWGMMIYYCFTNPYSVGIVDLKNLKVKQITLLVERDKLFTTTYWKDLYKNDTATLKRVERYEQFAKQHLRAYKIGQLKQNICANSDS